MAQTNLPTKLKRWRKRVSKTLGISGVNRVNWKTHKGPGFSQAEAAECIGIPRNTYRNWEEGRREPSGLGLESLEQKLKLIETLADGVAEDVVDSCEDCKQHPKIVAILRRIRDERSTDSKANKTSSKAA